MSKGLLICVLSVLLTSVADQNQSRARVANDQVDGDYVGIQNDPSLSPDEPQIKWFHENTLVIRNNEAILDKNPFTVEHGKKFYSASDGGFTTYRGRFVHLDGKTVVQLRLFQSDYILFPVGKEPYSEIKTYPVKVTSDGIEIDGVKYKRHLLNKTRREELLQLLAKEPLEKSKQK
jgi:hypothetical protein